MSSISSAQAQARRWSMDINTYYRLKKASTSVEDLEKKIEKYVANRKKVRLRNNAMKVVARKLKLPESTVRYRYLKDKSNTKAMVNEEVDILREKCRCEGKPKAIQTMEVRANNPGDPRCTDTKPLKPGFYLNFMSPIVRRETSY